MEINTENICIVLFTVLLLIFIYSFYKDSSKDSNKNSNKNSVMSAMAMNRDESDSSDSSDKFDPCEGKIKDPKLCKNMINTNISELNNLCTQDLSNPIIKSSTCSMACDNSKYFKVAYEKSSCLNVCGKCNKDQIDPICDTAQCSYSPCSSKKCKSCPGTEKCSYNMKDYSPQFN
jgi:hypothetical protein